MGSPEQALCHVRRMDMAVLERERAPIRRYRRNLGERVGGIIVPHAPMPRMSQGYGRAPRNIKGQPLRSEEKISLHHPKLLTLTHKHAIARPCSQ